MILYHGSNVSFREIDLEKGLPAKDFGRGFYMTDSMECAVKTAQQRVARLGGTPKLMSFSTSRSPKDFSIFFISSIMVTLLLQ